MAPFAKTTFVTGATPASAAELNNFGDGIVEAQRAPFVTALPTTGPGGGALADGQECYYKPDPTNATGNGNVAWHLKYESSSGKWYRIGGPPLVAEVLTQESVASVAYTTLTTAGPNLTIPLAGDYDVTIEYDAFISPAGAGEHWMSYQVGATAASDADGAPKSNWATNGEQGMASRTRRKTGLAAAVVLSSRYRTTAGTGFFLNRVLRVLPVRVG